MGVRLLRLARVPIDRLDVHRLASLIDTDPAEAWLVRDGSSPLAGEKLRKVAVAEIVASFHERALSVVGSGLKSDLVAAAAPRRVRRPAAAANTGSSWWQRIVAAIARTLRY